MSWSCRRPGCSRPAVAAIHYDPVSCQVWLDPVAPDDRSGQALCGEHIERLRPPRGWVVVDRLDAQAHLVTAVPVSPPRPAAPRTPRRAWGKFDPPTLEFTAEPHVPDPPETADLRNDLDDEPATSPEPDPDETRTAGPVVEANDDRERDDLASLFAPTGRLLSRAFSSSGPQRSVLTVEQLEDPANG